MGAPGWSQACGEWGVRRWNSQETEEKVSEQAGGGLGWVRVRGMVEPDQPSGLVEQQGSVRIMVRVSIPLCFLEANVSHDHPLAAMKLEGAIDVIN